MSLLRFVLIGLAAIILISLGWRLGTGPARMPTAQRPSAQVSPPAIQAAPEPRPAPDAPAQGPVPAPAPSAEAVERALTTLQQAPDLARAFDALKAQFPAAASQGLSDAVARSNAGSGKLSPDDIFAVVMRDLRQSAGVLAAKASPDSLAAIFDAQSAMLADLAQGDPRVCADYLYGGTSPEYSDFAAGHRALVAQSALAGITAMAEGRRLQVTRTPPSPDDFKRIEDGLVARGLSTDEIAALLDGKSPDPPLTDARLCANSRTYLDVLHALPPDTRDRVYGLAADLLARS